MTREADEHVMRRQRPAKSRQHVAKAAKDRARHDLDRRMGALSGHELAALSAVLSAYFIACGGRIPADETQALVFMACAADDALRLYGGR